MDACQALALEIDVERSILTTDLVGLSLLLRGSRVSGQGRQESILVSIQLMELTWAVGRNGSVHVE